MQPSKFTIQQFFEELQKDIISDLELEDSIGKFQLDEWKHPAGGGGISGIIQQGKVFEKGGVNTSAVNGILPDSIANRLNIQPIPFFATGISLVLHPINPFVPIVHANFRYFEMENGKWWFGGGVDLTPCYVFEEDAIYFHQTLKSTCDRFDPSFYSKFKANCDDYFFIKHRQETRGIGGIFFDYLQSDQSKNFQFIQTLGKSFSATYLPIVRKRKEISYGKKEKDFQEYRRGRYVEFNLVYDKGTLFGLETGGRIESILMSLPPHVQWVYNFQPEKNSTEEKLWDYLKPRNWLGLEE